MTGMEAAAAFSSSPSGPVTLLEHGAGELPDLGWQGHVAVRGGVGLAVVGEPVQHGDQGLPAGLVWLPGVDQRPAVPADGVAAGAGLFANIKMIANSPAAVAAAFSSSCSPVWPGDSRCAAMPEPITTAARNALPRNSAVSRRHSRTGALVHPGPGASRRPGQLRRCAGSASRPRRAPGATPGGHLLTRPPARATGRGQRDSGERGKWDLVADRPRRLAAVREALGGT